MKRFLDLFLRRSIKQQSVLLVSILVVGQIVLASALFMQLQQSSAEARQERHLKELLGRSQRLMFVMHDYSKAIVQFCNYMTPESEADLQKYVDEMQQLDSFILSNIKDYPTLHTRMEALSRVNVRVAKLTHSLRVEARKIPDKTNRFFFYGALQKQGLHNYAQWHDRSAEILQEEVALLQKLPGRQQSTRALLRITLIAGLAATIAIVFILMIFFTKHICLRLGTLVENTRLMSQYRPPHAPLAGCDEIASLDRSMQDMCEAITFAARERQAMLATVSHELRTPLNSVAGALELLASGDVALPTGARDSVLQAEMDTTTLINLITDLLDLEKMEAGQLTLEKELAYLEDAINAAIQSVEQMAAGKYLTIEFEGCDAEVCIDTLRMQQVFANLLKNAIQASPERSTIEVCTLETEQAIIVEIKDRGAGVPEALRQTLFDRFRHPREQDNAILRGMGLPICNCIMQLQNGTVSYGAAEVGSVFSITLPLGQTEGS